MREIAEGESTVSGARLGSIAHAVRRLADMTSPDRFAQAQRIDEEICDPGLLRCGVLLAALRRTWRISNSYAPISANDGHAAITRPVAVGSATATLAARLATLPTASNAHGSPPPRLPVRESASSVVEAATIIPSTDNGVSAATHPGCPCDSTSKCMCK